MGGALSIMREIDSVNIWTIQSLPGERALACPTSSPVMSIICCCTVGEAKPTGGGNTTGGCCGAVIAVRFCGGVEVLGPAPAVVVVAWCLALLWLQLLEVLGPAPAVVVVAWCLALLWLQLLLWWLWFQWRWLWHRYPG